MEKKMKKLSSAAVDTPCIIKKISLPQDLTNRLCELGIIPKTTVTPLFSAPSGEPRAYLIRGTQLALRREITDKIWVTEIPKGRCI